MSIGLIVLALAFVFFLVVAYFASQTWHWGHVVAMSFLFLFSLLFLFMGATLLKTHSVLRPKYANAVRDYENAVKQEQSLTFGSQAEPAGPGTLVGERRLAQIQQTAAGRTWGNVFPQVTPNQINLDMRRWTNDGCQKVGQEEEEFDDPIEPEPDPELSGDETDDAAADDAAVVADSSHGILQDQFVYAFHEYPIKSMTPEEKAYYFGTDSLNGAEFVDQDEKGNCRVPGAYLGKFRVVQATPERLTVEPAGQLTPIQRKQLGAKGPMWVLYEKLPTDSHDLFVEGDPTKLLPLRRFVERGVPEPAYRNMVQEYARDGDELDARANSLRHVQTIEFVKDYEQQVDFEVAGELPDTGVPFSADGRAQMKSLMLGAPAKFTAGDTVDVDGVLASKLIQGGFAKAVGKPKYSRELRDYQFLLDNVQLQLNEVAAEKNTVEGQVADLDASLQRLREQLDKHAEELRLLEEDKKGFLLETDQLAAFKQVLQRRLGFIRGQVEKRSFASR